METMGPESSLLAIEGWQIYVETNISFFEYPLRTSSP